MTSNLNTHGGENAARTIVKTPSQGLAYRVNDDGKTCEITGIGVCKEKKIIIPDAPDGYPVTGIAPEAFRGCTELIAVWLPDFLESVGEGAFRGCTRLLGVVVPARLTEIGALAFSGCTKLARMELPAAVTKIGTAAFAGAGEITVSEENPNYRCAGGNLYSSDGKILLHYAANQSEASFTVPDSVERVDDWAFFACASLEEVTVGESVRSIGENAFRWCKKLKKAVIGNAVTHIGAEAFLGCENMTSVTVGSAVKEIGKDTFAFCMSLESITLPDSFTDIADRAFLNCESLARVTVSNSVTAVGRGAFGRCRNLTDLRYTGNQDAWEQIAFQPDWKKGAAVREINFLATSHGADVSRGLQYRPHEDGVTCEITGIGACTDTNIVIPERIDEYRVTAIAAGAFRDSAELKQAVILESVTNVGDEAFLGCEALEAVTVGASVADIGLQAFSHCPNLSAIRYGGMKKQWKKITLGKKWRAASRIRRIECADKAIRFLF